jgi:hypothetical protein
MTGTPRKTPSRTAAMQFPFGARIDAVLPPQINDFQRRLQ